MFRWWKWELNEADRSARDRGHAVGRGSLHNVQCDRGSRKRRGFDFVTTLLIKDREWSTKSSRKFDTSAFCYSSWEVDWNHLLKRGRKKASGGLLSLEFVNWIDHRLTRRLEYRVAFADFEHHHIPFQAAGYQSGVVQRPTSASTNTIMPTTGISSAAFWWKGRLRRSALSLRKAS